MENQVGVENIRYMALPKSVKAIFIAFSSIGIGTAIFYLFGGSVRGAVLYDVAYYYIIIAFFSSNSFLILPARKKDKQVKWYDLTMAALTFCIAFYFCLKTPIIINVGWDEPSMFHFVLATIFCLLVLEGARRAVGIIYVIVCLMGAAYPLIAGYMPGMLWGVNYSFPRTVASLVYSSSGLHGVPMKVVGEILIGFLLFAAILIISGAGEFFLNSALAVFGRFRGGAAKVAIVSSGFFGSLSGSIFANIVSTGSVTIPAMKQTGYPSHYAAAIEACSSTGGVLMPPVMGAVAFIMCVTLGVPYSTVVIAAVIPAILYYFGLLLQVDSYAANYGICGVPSEDIPSFKKTLKDGWQFIIIFIFLIWGIVYMRWEAMSPFYASGLMVFLSLVNRKNAITPKKIIEIFVIAGKMITQTVAIILPMGFVICGLAITGVDNAFTSALVSFGGGNVFLILLFGVIACFIMGMAGLLVAAYIILAVTLAPAIIQIAEFNELAVHLFIIYYAMISAITPPVAPGAFLAAAIAGSKPMKTGFQAMRLGIVIYFIPFFFVFNPNLILQGSVLSASYLFMLALFGVALIAGGMEGYLLMIGNIKFWFRPFFITAGILFAFPEWKTSIIGVCLALILIILVKKKSTHLQREIC